MASRGYDVAVAHVAFPTLGSFTAEGDSYIWVPVSYMFGKRPLEQGDANECREHRVCVSAGFASIRLLIISAVPTRNRAAGQEQ